MLKTKNKLVLSTLGALFTIFITVSPVIIIRHGLIHFWDHWQETAFYLTCIAGGVISTMMGFSLSAGLIEVKRQRTFLLLILIVYFLYVACSALCQKIHFGALDSDWWRTSGLVVLWVGTGIRLWAVSALGRFHSGFVTIQDDHHLVRTGPYKWLRHPSYLGALIFMVSIPMIFGSWFPLLALPGIFVCLRWRIEDEERMLADQFTEDFEAYKRETWRMIPHVY